VTLAIAGRAPGTCPSSSAGEFDHLGNHLHLLDLRPRCSTAARTPPRRPRTSARPQNVRMQRRLARTIAAHLVQVVRPRDLCGVRIVALLALVGRDGRDDIGGPARLCCSTRAQHLKVRSCSPVEIVFELGGRTVIGVVQPYFSDAEQVLERRWLEFALRAFADQGLISLSGRPCGGPPVPRCGPVRSAVVRWSAPQEPSVARLNNPPGPTPVNREPPHPRCSAGVRSRT